MGLFMDHLRMLEYRHRPDYDYINSLFNQMLENEGIPEDEPYDWEKNAPSQTTGSNADINSAAHENARSGQESRIPRAGGRSERKQRESPHDKATGHSQGPVNSTDMGRSGHERRGASSSKVWEYTQLVRKAQLLAGWSGQQVQT